MEPGLKKGAQAGFSLIEMMVALGVGAIAMYGVMSFTEFTVKATRNVQLSGDFNQLVASVQLVLNNETACNKAFVINNKTFNPAANATTAVNDLTLDSSTILTTVNPPQTGLRVLSFGFVNTGAPQSLGTNAYVGNLRLTAEKILPGQTVGQGMRLSRTFNMYVEINPSGTPANEITKCFGEASPSQACMDLGGTYSDSTNPKCRIQNFSTYGTGGGSVSTGSVNASGTVIASGNITSTANNGTIQIIGNSSSIQATGNNSVVQAMGTNGEVRGRTVRGVSQLCIGNDCRTSWPSSDTWAAGMWCGLSYNSSCSGSGDAGSTSDVVYCQGYDPNTSCPSGFTRVTFAQDRRKSSKTSCFYTCIKN